MNKTLTRGEQRAQSVARRAETDAHQAARRSRGWLVPLGRAGYAANGIVYAIVGALAAQAALGVGGGTTDKGGALGQIIQAPFGRVLLAIVAIGLAGYAVWRFVQAALDTERKDGGLRGLAHRSGHFVTGCVYVGLALSAATMAIGTGGQPNEDQSTQDRTAWLMSQPFGTWLVGGLGLIVIGVGLVQLVHAYRASFREDLQTDEMTPAEERWAVLAGRLGYAARGVVFGLIGAFLVVAAVQSQPDQARGLGGALATLAEQPFGQVLLGVAALGLIAYGLFMLVLARYRRMVVN